MPRLNPCHPAIIDRLYALYLRCHGAEFAAQQYCLYEMAEAAAKAAQVDRWIKGLHDTLAGAFESGGSDDLLADLTHLHRLRASALRAFDRALRRFADIRADRNLTPSDGPERIEIPKRTLVPNSILLEQIHGQYARQSHSR